MKQHQSEQQDTSEDIIARLRVTQGALDGLSRKSLMARFEIGRDLARLHDLANARKIFHNGKPISWCKVIKEKLQWNRDTVHRHERLFRQFEHDPAQLENYKTFEEVESVQRSKRAKTAAPGGKLTPKSFGNVCDHFVDRLQRYSMNTIAESDDVLRHCDDVIEAIEKVVANLRRDSEADAPDVARASEATKKRIAKVRRKLERSPKSMHPQDGLKKS